MDTYHRWLEINILASLLGLPVVSVPGDDSEVNLPLGIQFIAKSHDDSALLQTVLQIYNKSSWKELIADKYPIIQHQTLVVNFAISL